MKRVFVALCILVISCFTSTSTADVRFQRTANSNVSTALWSVAVVGANQSVTTAPYTLTWTVRGGTAYNYFYLRNNGEILIQSFTMNVSETRVGGNAPANEIVFESCLNGTWSLVTNLCSGTINLVGKASDLVIRYPGVNLLVGAQLELRARTNISGRNNFSTKIETSVSRSDVRAGQSFSS